MKKRILIHFLVLVMLILPVPSLAAPQSQIKVTLNGKVISTKVTQLADKSRYLPIKDLLTPLGYKLSFDASAKATVAIHDKSKLVFPVGQKYILKNGQKVTIPKAIASYNGTTCISSDSLTPALNATCLYFPDTNTLQVQIFSRLIDTFLSEIPPLTMPEKELKHYKTVLSKKIDYAIDERLFTYMAYVHYLGYNADYGSGYSETRKKMLADLKALNLDLSAKVPNIKPFFRSGTTANIARALGPAPTFAPLNTVEQDYDEAFLNEVSLALQEFYTAADIHSLFLKYKKDYEAAITAYKQSDLMDGICKILYFLKIKAEDAPSMTILVNLTDASLVGIGLIQDLGLNKPTIIMGPATASAGKTIIIHEYLHGIIGPILKKYQKEVDATNQMATVSDSAFIQSHYNDWSAIVEESVVRSLDFIPFAFPRHYQIGQNKEQGFIMIDYFFNGFAKYPNTNDTLDAYLYKLLTQYKVS